MTKIYVVVGISWTDFEIFRGFRSCVLAEVFLSQQQIKVRGNYPTNFSPDELHIQELDMEDEEVAKGA